MFLKTEQIRESLEPLKSLHPFYGITFIVCKKAALLVGDTIQFPINARETEFIDEYFKPEKNSKYYYQVFQTSNSLYVSRPCTKHVQMWSALSRFGCRTMRDLCWYRRSRRFPPGGSG